MTGQRKKRAKRSTSTALMAFRCRQAAASAVLRDQADRPAALEHSNGAGGGADGVQAAQGARAAEVADRSKHELRRRAHRKKGRMAMPSGLFHPIYRGYGR